MTTNRSMAEMAAFAKDKYGEPWSKLSVAERNEVLEYYQAKKR